jgi:tetratricopeptide (TPR) repeat protein
MKTARMRMLSLSLFGFVLMSSSLLKAQDARFRGTVKDEQGNPVAKAVLTLTLPERGLSFSFETNDKGKFYRRGIDPGTYLLTLKVEGYEPLEQQITISVGEEYTMDIVLAQAVSEEAAKNRFLLGVQLYQEGKYDQAIENFEVVLKENPDFAEGHYNIGMALLRKGDPDAALARMKKAIEIKSDFLAAYFGMGQAYIEKGDYEQAISVYQKALAIKPEDAEVHLNLGILYFNSQNDDLAEAALLKARELNPSLVNTYYQLGLLYLRREEIEKSRQNFERFLELAPQASEAAAVKNLLEELKKRNDHHPGAGHSSSPAGN